MTEKNLITLGTLKRPHGLKGDVEFWTAAGNETHLEAGHLVWLFPLEGSILPKEGKVFELAQVRRGNAVLIRFKGVPDRTALEKILPCELKRAREDFPPLDEGSYYVTDLVGLTAVNEEGERIGKIVDYFETPAQLVFTIRLKNGEELDLPYVEAFFPEVDLERQEITVVLPEVME